MLLTQSQATYLRWCGVTFTSRFQRCIVSPTYAYRRSAHKVFKALHLLQDYCKDLLAFCGHFIYLLNDLSYVFLPCRKPPAVIFQLFIVRKSLFARMLYIPQLLRPVSLHSHSSLGSIALVRFCQSDSQSESPQAIHEKNLKEFSDQ